MQRLVLGACIVLAACGEPPAQIEFADVTARAGIAFRHNSGAFGKKYLPETLGSGACFLDYDDDGWQDLLVVNSMDWPSHRAKPSFSALYRNNRDGTFKDVTREAGLEVELYGLGCAVADYDNDGRIDLFVANDTEPNRLYRNNGNGTFREVGAAAGVAYADSGTARAGMGTDAGDHDNSGRQGLVVGNFTDEGLALYRNEGAGLFTDIAASNGVRRLSLQSLTFAAFFFDYDLDGRLDVLAVNGHVSDDVSVVQPHVKHAQAPHLFRNLGGGRFEEATGRHGRALQAPVVGRGAAYADIDNDGDLDLVITANNGAARLLRNDQSRRNDALRVKTVGTRSNRDGIGARVSVASSTGLRLRAMVKTGSSYLSQSELPLTFGLGPRQPSKTVDVEIAWPSGARDAISNLAPNQSITVVEGKGAVAALPLR